MTSKALLAGERFALTKEDTAYPAVLRTVPRPPECIYGVGNPAALKEGLAVVGARKATPYGRGCARRFAGRAAERGITIISGGARGCDSEAHRAALEAGAPTVAVLGGGVDRLYPAENRGLFQEIIDKGGAVISEHEWDFAPLRATFRERNRIIAGMGLACLIVEAGLPSGTLSTADDAVCANRDVCVVPGAITAPSSHGANWLLSQGAQPIIDDKTFDSMLMQSFGVLTGFASFGEEVQGGESAASSSSCDENGGHVLDDVSRVKHEMTQALLASPLTLDDLHQLLCDRVEASNLNRLIMRTLVEAEQAGRVQRCPDGRYSMVS